jgi:hypothetical protein
MFHRDIIGSKSYFVKMGLRLSLSLSFRSEAEKSALNAVIHTGVEEADLSASLRDDKRGGRQKNIKGNSG